MTTVTTSSKPKGMKKKTRGSHRARVGLDAKAGKRKAPAVSGPHTTTEHDRKRAMLLHGLGIKFYKRPGSWLGYKETS